MGRTIKENRDGIWIASEYDSLGFRIQLESSLGFIQNITRNTRGEALKVSANSGAFEATFNRNDAGQEIERNLPGGIQSRWIRDRLGRPIRHEILQNKHIHQSKTFVWGLNDRLLKLIDTNNRETIFQHDPLGNLISARYNDGSFDLRMPDAVGNLFKTHALNDREYGLAGQLLAVNSPQGDTKFQYNAEGNLISKIEPGNRRWSYEWNCSNLLTKVIRPDNNEIQFEYDALGRRILKKFNGKITYWIWDGNNPLHEWVEHSEAQANLADFPIHRSIPSCGTWG